MTKILIDRSTVEQALEALEFPAVSFPVDRHKAAVALRAALAESGQEPVAIVEMVVPHLESIIVKHILGSRFPKVGDYLYTHPPRRAIVRAAAEIGGSKE